MSQKQTFRNKDANNNPVLTIIIGILLIAAGVGFYFLIQGKELDYPQLTNAICFIIMGIGAIIFIFSIFRLIILSKAKKLRDDENAFVTTAKFVKARISSGNASDTRVLGIPVKANTTIYSKVFYEYTDECGVTHKVKSVNSFTKNQVDYLKSLESIKIKCKGKLSVIIEEIENIEKTFEMNLLKKDVKIHGEDVLK